MAARDVVRAINAGRVALGVSLVLAPRRIARVWIGDDACRDGTAVVARAHGTREIVLGSLAIGMTAGSGAGSRRTQAALAVCDLVDLAVTVGARRSLPRSSRLVALLAAVGMVGQAWAARRLGEAPPAGAADEP